MPDDILEDLISWAQKCTKDENVETNGNKVAEKIKNYMDEKYEFYWHVFIGKSFGSFATHEINRFAYFTLTIEKNKYYFLVYKSS